MDRPRQVDPHANGGLVGGRHGAVRAEWTNGLSHMQSAAWDSTRGVYPRRKLQQCGDRIE